MFLLEILIYVLFAVVLSYLARGSEYYTTDPKKWDGYLIGYVAFFTLIGAVRWNVGSDSVSYALCFDLGFYADLRPELLWQGFMDLIYNLGIHWTVAMGILAFLQIYFIVKSVKSYRFILVLLPFVLFGGRYWQDLMGGIRQMLVSCAFLWATKFIVEKKFWKYLLFILIASQVHRSSLLLLPVYFIPSTFELKGKRSLLLVILLGCCIIGQTPAYQGAVSYIKILTNMIGYEEYSSRLSTSLMQGNSQEGLAFGPMMLTYLLIPMFIVWFGRNLKEEYGDKIPYFNFWYAMSYFYACAYFLVCNIGHIFIRPTLYFSLFQMIMATLLLDYLIHKVKENPNLKLVTMAFIIIIFTNTGWDIYKASSKPWESVTYKAFFTHYDQVKALGLGK